MSSLFFDLDGTITDPLFGITSSYQRVLQEFGLQVPSTEDLKWTIGPQLRTCLSQLLNTSDPKVIESGVERYRHYYVEQKLMYHDKPYPGIRKVLEELSTKYPLYLATAKARPYAIEILKYNQLDGFFKAMYGCELDGTRSNKADLIAYILEQEGLNADSCLMIGDRIHDIKAAQSNGIPTLAVGYGYGDPSEWKQAAHFVSRVEEITQKVYEIIG